ncbi:YdcH family protein [Mesorhizobium qingshengii]|uniref:DUF465 domain-containing protein n=1 Tax=Mesorhizobium qingshengii TaxID=1165689 RepID=A0A1G5ZE81_9HYPH|nr:YdcH family protein [Mesorhizobium qingshengii]SDA92780.1 hypothetical protein SAMN02927914_04825 [Mesorhizobium qingshengii]
MDQFIKSLRHRRATVQARIEDEQARPAPDQLRLSALKRLKLRFRDQIEFIERINRSGDTIPIPVVRRRSFRPLLSGKI